MKFVTLILPTIFFLSPSVLTTPPSILGAQPSAAITAQDSDARPLNTEATIEPGSRVGPLKLGDTRDRALELFPKKSEDQEWENSCGTTLDWVDAENRTGHGDLLIRLKKGKIFQIESTTTRFHTPEGITTFDHADKVVSAYRDMRAYTLLTPPVPALGDRPLVFWVDKRKGIAFVFAYYPAEHKRYIYKIIIFEPNKNFCPEEETTGSPKWQPISPYALEPPPELAPNL